MDENGSSLKTDPEEMKRMKTDSHPEIMEIDPVKSTIIWISRSSSF